MIKDFEILKRNYAKLLVNRGLVTTKDREIWISADLDQPEFVNLLTEECYNAGAKMVRIFWTDRKVDRLIRERTSLDELDKLLPVEKEKILYQYKNNVCRIYLESNDPYYLNGVDSKKAVAGQAIKKAFANKCKGEKHYTAPYTIACLPSKPWAKLLFPKLKEDVAIEEFWKLIFKIAHVSSSDPYKEWDKHCIAIDNRAKWLNKLNIKEFHLTSKNGTDLKVGMTDKYQFAGTADYDIISKKKYYSNIPTEECFVSPDRNKAEGTLCSSLPLAYDGQIIEGIKLKLKNGRIVSASAKKGDKALKELVATDEGTHHFGEFALVPYNSPIRNTGMLFYNTLFDENAACHFAIGEAYFYTYKGYENMSTKQLKDCGLNLSSRHIDFMIGTKDLNIVATTYSGKKIQIFKNGNWAK